VIAHQIECGALYNLRVTAVNVAGESDATVGAIKVGEPPSPPLSPRRTSITPGVEVTIAWDHSLDDGCLPVRYHSISRNGGDLAEQVAPDTNSFQDDISSASSYPLGTQITYRIKAVNDAGESPYSEPLVVTVGRPPLPPTGIVISRRLSETAVEIQWTADA
jgi:hypothetical protein